MCLYEPSFDNADFVGSVFGAIKFSKMRKDGCKIAAGGPRASLLKGEMFKIDEWVFIVLIPMSTDKQFNYLQAIKNISKTTRSFCSQHESFCETSDSSKAIS